MIENQSDNGDKENDVSNQDDTPDDTLSVEDKYA